MPKNWTEDQLKAINDKGHNIIVSAGAGSGKTAVLSQRVLEHILVDKWDIDKLLVLTFTNAAAASMKNKIRNVINTSTELDNTNKTKQLNKIDGSYIMTFDAYALSLVKKYHYLLNVDRNINVIDSGILKIKTDEFLDEIMLSYYQSKNAKFNDLISAFCVKNDESIREVIVKINDKLNTIYNRDKYCNSYESNFFNDAAIDDLINKYVDIVFKKQKKVIDLLNEISFDIDVDEYFPWHHEFTTCTDYSILHDITANVDFKKRLPSGSDDTVKKLKEKIGKQVKEIAKMTVDSLDELENQLISTKDNSLMLIELAQKLNMKLLEYKKENNLFEFSDIFRMAIEIVDKHQDIRNEIKDYFYEILVDEYQDTNDLQEEFIAKIAKDNVYMVGDIKQSIYRFRNANPDIFKNKYDNYKAGINGQAIDLLANFRSRQEVLDGINQIFNRLMTGEIGGADYDPGHQMNAGNKAYSSDGIVSKQNNKLTFINYQYNDETKNSYPFDNLTRHEAEAFIIGNDIKEKIESHYQVFVMNEETNQMELRDCRYEDFCILIDRKTEFDTYKAVLNSLEIPVNIEQDEKMSDSSLFTVVKSIFKLIKYLAKKDYSDEFKHAYLSVGRSFLCQISDDRLHDSIVNKTFYNTELFKTIQKITNNISVKSISEILEEIITEFDIYAKINKIGDVSDNMVKIDYLYQLAHNLNQMNYSYLDFVDYLDKAFDGEKNDITFNTSKNDINAVKMMTIHGSKGLEFTICYFPSLFKKFNDSDKKENIVFTKDSGIIMPAVIADKGNKNSVSKEIFKKKYDEDEVSEKIRLFYVALTRTREKMICIGSLDNKDESDGIVDQETRLSIKSFIDMLNPIYNTIAPYIVEIDDFSKLLIYQDYRNKAKKIFDKIVPASESIVITQASHHFNPVEIAKSHASKDAGLISKQARDKMNFGTRMHYYLETLDFINPDYSVIDENYIVKIQKFLSSDLMNNIANGKAYKEYEFIYQQDNDQKHGIIDLLVEYPDHFDIIDYKLKNIDDEHYDQQLNTYRQYIKSITSKPVNCYLYSIIDSNYRTVSE